MLRAEIAITHQETFKKHIGGEMNSHESEIESRASRRLLEAYDACVFGLGDLAGAHRCCDIRELERLPTSSILTHIGNTTSVVFMNEVFPLLSSP